MLAWFETLGRHQVGHVRHLIRSVVLGIFLSQLLPRLDVRAFYWIAAFFAKPLSNILVGVEYLCRPLFTTACIRQPELPPAYLHFVHA